MFEITGVIQEITNRAEFEQKPGIRCLKNRNSEYSNKIQKNTGGKISQIPVSNGSSKLKY